MLVVSIASEPSSDAGVWNLLCKFNAELREVFPRGGQVVTDDGDVLFNVKDDRGDVGALVTNVLHILPLHLKMEQGGRSLQSLCRRAALPVPGEGVGTGV